MVRNSKKIIISRQCELLYVSRRSHYYEAIKEDEKNLLIMKEIDGIYLNHHYYGSRRMLFALKDKGYEVSSHTIRRLMRKMGLYAIYQRPRTSKKNDEHNVYPYLLRNLIVDKPNQAWCSDITYIPVRNGFMYLVVVMDWYSRKVLSWRLSNSMDVNFCKEALEEAIDIYSKPEIFNTDQGIQFTSNTFTDVLKVNDIRISMDGKRTWIDNVFIERFWRSIKYECIYIQEFDNTFQLSRTIDEWVDFYNKERPHFAFAGQSPDMIYNPGELRVSGSLQTAVSD